MTAQGPGALPAKGRAAWIQLGAGAMLAICAVLGVAPAAAYENAVNVSWGDHIVVSEGLGKLDTPERIGGAMDEWMRLTDARTIYWRVSAWYAREYLEQRVSSFPRYFEEVERIWAAFDPLACAVQEAHKRGLRIYAYQTIYDEGSPTSVKYGDSTPFPWQSRFTIEHPEYVVCDCSGEDRQWGVMEYAYPEARRYTLGVLTRLLDEYDFDGLYVCTRTHSRPADVADQYGYNEPVVEAYRQRYGKDIRSEEFDRQQWRDLRGEFLTQLLRELRAATEKRGKRVALAIPRGDITGPPYGNMTMDWRTWVREGLVDELVVGVTSGNWHYPSMRGQDRERGYLASQDEDWGLPPFDEAVRGDYGPLCREGNVALLIQGGTWGKSAGRRLQELGLSGYMFSTGALEGRPAYLAVPDHPSLGFTDGRLTVECWLKYPGEVTYGRVISKYDHTLGDEGRGWEVYIDKDAHVVWRLNDGETDRSITTESTVPGGQWFHLACVSEGAGGAMRVAINGQPDGVTTPAPAALRSVPVDLCIGAYGGGGVFLEAWVDEMRLSNTSREFTIAPTGPAEADGHTVALWRLEEDGFRQRSEVGGEEMVVEVMRFGGPEHGDGPPGCGKAVFLGQSK